MKLRLFGPGGRVWRLAFRIKHTAKSLKYRQLYNIRGGGGGVKLKCAAARLWPGQVMQRMCGNLIGGFL